MKINCPVAFCPFPYREHMKILWKLLSTVTNIHGGHSCYRCCESFAIAFEDMIHNMLVFITWAHFNFLIGMLFLGAFAWLRKVTVSFAMSVCPVPSSTRMKQFSSHWTGFHEILLWELLLQSTEKIQTCLKSDKISGTLDRVQSTFMIILRWILPGMSHVSETRR